MTTTQWSTIAGGVVAIVWVNWYFFLAEAKAPHSTRSTDRPTAGE
jgi:hypothetical protein